MRGRRVRQWILLCAAICFCGPNPSAAAAAVGSGYDRARVAIVVQARKQAAASSMKPSRIEPYIDYPFTTRHPGGAIVLRSAADLRRNFLRIFDDRVRSAILSQNSTRHSTFTRA